MKNAYVTALTNSILAGQSVEEVLVNTKALLKKRGHERLWSQILRATSRVLEAKLKRQSPQVAVSAIGQVDEAAIKVALKQLGVEAEAYETSIDSTLIGGFTARFKGQMIDGSYKRALTDLYRKVTK